MHRKKIIHLIQSLDSGGCENMLLRTLPLLTDFEHKIITLNHRGELAEQLKEKKIYVINIGQKNLSDIFSCIRLLNEIKKEKPDLIITYLFHADFIGRFFLQVFNRTKIIPFLRTTYNHKKYRIARLFEKFTKYFVKRYLANSQSVKDFYIKNIGVSPEKITVIPNGIDVEFYDKTKRDEAFRKNLGINPEDTTIICVANLHINKGHTYLLKAFEKVYQANQDVKLLLVGNGEEKENLQKQIENYKSKNSISFLGKRNDVPQLLKISDIFVLPTFFEGMSNALMEAMACGLPIITTDIPENKELIKNNINGILVPIKNSSEIEKNINELISNKNLEEKLSEKAKQIVAKQYSLYEISKRINDFIINSLNLR